MITINGIQVEQGHFPDGTLMMLNLKTDLLTKGTDEPNGMCTKASICWKYESDAELFTLICLVKHIRKNFYVDSISLMLPYLPHARMDRTKSNTEVFTLKHFSEVINSLGFDRVYVLDPHSNVSEALIDNIIVLGPEAYITNALNDIEGKDIDGGKTWGGKTIIYFPDEGALKRYRGLPVFTGRKLIYGKKERDWKTGKINGLSIYTEGDTPIKEFGETPLKGEVVLMIDDIISYGGTFAYSADEIKKLGASAIYAYASHTENSMLDEERGTFIKRLNEGIVDELFTTNSIFKYQHPRVTVFETF